MNDKPLWSDVDALTLAVQTSKTQAEAIRKMGREPKAAGYALFRRKCREAGVDYSHLVLTHSRIALYGIPPEDIACALRESASIGDVADYIRVPKSERTFRALREFAQRNNIPCPPPRKPSMFDDEERLRAIIAVSVSAKNALDLMGSAASSKSYSSLRRAMAKFDINDSIFENNRKNGITPHKGLRYDVRPSRSYVKPWRESYSESFILREYERLGTATAVADSLGITEVSRPSVALWVSQVLKRNGVSISDNRGAYGKSNTFRLIDGQKYNRNAALKAMTQSGMFDMRHCSICGIPDEWNNLPLTLHIDHIDGDTYNNDPSNLRIVCPNCHTQTPTYCVGNRKVGLKARKAHEQQTI